MFPLLVRVPVPVVDPGVAQENRRLVCDARGYCGPFVNQDFYDRFCDELWHGMAECAQCGNTVRPRSEETKRLRLDGADDLACAEG